MHLIHLSSGKKTISFDSKEILETAKFSFFKGRKFEVWVDGKTSQEMSFLQLLKIASEDKTLHENRNYPLIKRCFSSLQNAGYEKGGKFESIRNPFIRILTLFKHIFTKKHAITLFAKLPLTPKENFERVRALAEKEDAEAQNALGDCYYKGIGTAQDKKEAYRWYKKGADLGSTKAKDTLGFLYFESARRYKDDKRIFQAYEKSADLGYPLAQIALAHCYRDGKGVPKSDEAAFFYYQRAADQENQEAEVLLGDCYRDGIYVEKNTDEALRLYRKAASEGSIRAKGALVDSYLNGTCTFRDEEIAFRLLKQFLGKEGGSLQKGFFYNYQTYLDQGILSDVNILLSKAESPSSLLMEAEADGAKGNTDALSFLGICYLTGSGVLKDEKKAIEYFKKGNDVKCKWFLAHLALNGIGMPKNEEEAVKSLQELAKEPNSLSHCSLAECYLNGIGTVKDEKLAFQWYKEAFDHQSEYAKYRLGYCYRNGIGVEMDLDMALKYYLEASEGNLFAAFSVGHFLRNGIGGPRNENEAVKWFNKVSHGISVS